MESIMFDFNIIKYYTNNLLNKLENIPKVKNYLGIIIITSKNIIQKIDNIKNKQDKFVYINSDEFIDNIIYYVFFDCNIQKKLCKIININPKYLDNLIDSFLLNFPNDFMIGIKIDISKIKNYINLNFHIILLCENKYFCLYKFNNINTTKNININDIKYISKYIDKENCSLKIKLENETINKLKKFSFIGSTLNKNKTISQKEISGRLLLKKIDNNLNHILYIDNDSIQYGDEDKVNVTPGLYNFHSHPYYTYHKFNVKHAYPSAHDYVGFISSMFIYGTIAHFVLTIEGIYIITLNKIWINKKSKLLSVELINFVMNNYKVKNNDIKTTDEYINIIQNIKYKNKQLFNIYFYNWNISEILLDINYLKENNNCLYNDDMLFNK
jgi:hypothetical protein